MAVPQLADLVLETSNAPGTGPIVLGGAPEGRQTFADAFPAGGEVYYYASDGQQTEWGVGTLTVGSPNTLARTTVLGNLFGTKTALNFTQNITVWCEIPAEKCAYRNDDGALPVRAETDYTQDEAVSAKSAEARFAKITDPLVRSLISPGADYLVDKIAAHQTNGRLWFHYTDKDGKENYPETALASELTAGLGAKANLSGGNTFLNGNQTSTGGYFIGNGEAGSDVNGRWAQGFSSYLGSGNSSFTHRSRDGQYEYLSLQLVNSDSSWHQLEFRPDDRLYTISGNKFALVSELPFSNTGLKMQAFQVTGTRDTRVSFPTAFRSGTVPFVFLQINSEPSSQVSRYSPLLNSGSGNTPDVNNQNFMFSPLYTVSGGSGQSGQPYVLNVLAVGYF